MSALPMLSKKFTSKRNVALIFIVSATIFQLVSIIGSIADANHRHKQLVGFETTSGSPPSSTTTQTQIVYALLQLVGLIGFGFALFTLIENPFHLK